MFGLPSPRLNPDKNGTGPEVSVPASFRERIERKEKELLQELSAKLQRLPQEEQILSIQGLPRITRNGLTLGPEQEALVDEERVVDRLSGVELHWRGVRKLKRQAIRVAKELLSSAKSKGIVPQKTRFRDEALSDEELASIRIDSAKCTGLVHLAHEERTGVVHEKHGREDRSCIHRGRTGIVISQCDGGGGVPLVAIGAELMANSATLHAQELMEEHRGSLIDPNFLGELHTRIYLDIVRWSNALGLDPEHAMAQVFWATSQITLVNKREAVVLAVADGFVGKGSETLQSMSSIQGDIGLYLPPTLSGLVVHDCDQKLLNPKEIVGTHLADEQLGKIAYRARGFQIMRYGEARKVLEGAGLRVSTDGARHSLEVRDHEGFFAVSLQDICDNYPDDSDDILALLNLAVDFRKYDQEYRAALGKDNFSDHHWFSGASLVSDLLHLDEIAKAVKDEGVRELDILLSEMEGADENAPILSGARKFSAPELWKFIEELGGNHAVADEIARHIRHVDGDPFFASKLAQSTALVMMPKIREAALRILKDRFDLDPEGKPVWLYQDDVTYHWLRLLAPAH